MDTSSNSRRTTRRGGPIAAGDWDAVALPISLANPTGAKPTRGPNLGVRWGFCAVAPTIFAEDKHASRSERDSYVPTAAVGQRRVLLWWLSIILPDTCSIALYRPPASTKPLPCN